MKKFILYIGFCALVIPAASAQVYITRTGVIQFFSKTPMEDIKAENNQVYAAIDLSQKTMAFSMLMKSFLFRKELMQEHFNENYVESDRYPKSLFKGTFTGDVDLQKPQIYNIRVQGVITLHGVEKSISTPATLEVTADGLTGTARFNLLPQDFDITIPGIVRDKIARQIDVQVKISCKPVN
ncbi:YceI family protein [Agriterribacter sp.]|uniref:YceI family protein n=1 Tax=Agriterribacter sp. TaxID=2821509 RepID=UPI002C655D12|nr:YceI family protein [Agriterribacter sp.]HRO45701.1 YceI family protein [Agriterribacter sp.]HRQ15821.1 YceI family protein [Agriterribacter sp.]